MHINWGKATMAVGFTAVNLGIHVAGVGWPWYLIFAAQSGTILGAAYYTDPMNSRQKVGTICACKFTYCSRQCIERASVKHAAFACGDCSCAGLLLLLMLGSELRKACRRLSFVRLHKLIRRCRLMGCKLVQASSKSSQVQSNGHQQTNGHAHANGHDSQPSNGSLSESASGLIPWLLKQSHSSNKPV